MCFQMDGFFPYWHCNPSDEIVRIDKLVPCQKEYLTRSAARHLRRKRLNDARKAEKVFVNLVYGDNDNADKETAVEKDTEQTEVLTKSKARRLRQKNKVKLLQEYCPCSVYSYSRDYDGTDCEEDEESKEVDEQIAKGLTKSKARRLRKKKKIKQLERAFCFCSKLSKPSTDLVKYGEPTEYNTGCCNELDVEVIDNHKQPCKLEKIDAQAQNEKKVEYLESELQNTELESSKYERLIPNSYTSFASTGLPKIEDEEDAQSKKLQGTSIHDQSRKELPSSRESKAQVERLEVNNVPYEKRTEDPTSKTRSPSKSSRKKLDDVGQKVERNSKTKSNDSSKIIPQISEETSTEVPCAVPTRINSIESVEESRTRETTNSEVSTVPEVKSAPINSIEVVQVQTSSQAPNKPIGMTDNKAGVPEKTREEIKAEREAKKAAKAAAKAKAKGAKVQGKETVETPAPSESKSKNDKTTCPTESIANEEPTKTSNTTTVDKAPTSSKETPLEVKTDGKSKAELRAERRAKQEAQRAAKQQLTSDKSKTKSKEVVETPTIVVPVDSAKKSPVAKKIIVKDNAHEVNLFKHLYHERELAIVDVPSVNSNIHRAIVRLGVQYANKVIVGSNARCVALLAAVKQLIQDFERPSQADFIRGLEASLQESAAYLHHCRPLAVSMQNALRHLKWQMTQLPSTMSDVNAKNELGVAIDTYIKEQIQLADKAISITIQTKISNGNVILTYGYSSLIHKILLDAHTAGKKFRVIVVDGRPWLEGKEQLRRLAKHGIECSYILINALSFVMPEVSKVFLGAHAILANGAVMSRVGTAQVALMARAFNVPVLVACETHKSCERVQTDSIVYNELGNADELAQNHRTGTKKSLLANWRTKKSLNLLNITYDVTPADLVTAVVTELAILPCTSVPVILRIKPSEI